MEKIGTGFWVEGFGKVDMYFENDIPIEDIDITYEKHIQIKEAASKAIDQMFKRIESMKKE